MYDCILFDLDGTLLLKSPSVPEKIFELLSSSLPGFSPDDAERAWAETELWQGEQIRRETLSGVQMPDEEYLENLLAIYRKHFKYPPETESSLETILRGQYSKSYTKIPDVLCILNALQKRNIPLGVVSNNHSGVRTVLDELGLTPFFGCIVISEEVGLYKPDPEILALACKKLGVSTEKCLYVGDHPFDVLCAHDAGMHAAWIPTSQFLALPAWISSPEYRLNSLADLPSLL